MEGAGFWGIVLKPEKRYEQIVETPFHVSKACMVPSSSGSEVTSVIVEVDSEEFIICNLGGKLLNESLSLHFSPQEKVCFRTSGGSATVHLTGNVLMDSYDMDEEDDEEEEEEEESEEEQIPLLKNGKRKNVSDAILTPNKKQRNDESLDKLLKSKAKEVAKVKSRKPEEIKAAVEQANKVKNGLIKAAKKTEDSNDDDEDSSEDDMDFTDAFAQEAGSDSDDEEDSDEGEEDSEEEEMVVEAKSPSKAKTPPAKKNDNKTNGQSPKTPKQDEKTPNKKDANKTPNKTPVKRNIKGIMVEDLKVGGGPEAKSGKMIGMYYDGRLKSGKRFDANLSGKPFRFRLGAGEVIKGWDLGLAGMKVGGKRKLTIPPNMAYGSKGAPPDIPPNSPLVFEVECKFVN